MQLIQIAPAEIEDGCIEYKRNFINVNNSRLNHLTAQMNWRINEGNGICYYYLGVCDNGYLYENFTQEELDYSLDIIKLMTEGCNSYIENIIINRVNEHLWLNIIIKKNPAYLTEYRILAEPKNTNINKLIVDYNKSTGIYFNSVIHNNERYLFFECNKKYRNKIEKIIDFNLIINNNFNSFDELINHVENKMSGNNIIDSEDVIFNIIKHNNINNIGHIIFGYLKQGCIKKNMILKSKEMEVQVLSIHNNYIDCTEIIAPATISIRVGLNNNLRSLNGYLYNKIKYLDQKQQDFYKEDLKMDLEIRALNRRQQERAYRKERRLAQLRVE